MADLNGTWTGRLIDICGFEGDITLHLEESRGSVRGRADVRVHTQHELDTYRVPLAGEVGERDRLVLKGSAGEKTGVDFGIDAVVFEPESGGVALRGTYDVAARQFTALRGGVVVSSKGGRLPTVEVRPEQDVPRRESAKPEEARS